MDGCRDFGRALRGKDRRGKRDVERCTLEPKYLTYVRDTQRAPSKLGDCIAILTLVVVF